MGYRLVPTFITYPATLRPGKKFTVRTEWENRGVGRALADYALSLRLVDGRGRTVAACDAGPLGTDEWLRGRRYPAENTTAFDGVPVGAYELRFAVTDPRTGTSIALPLAGPAQDRSHAAGGVTVR